MPSLADLLADDLAARPCPAAPAPLVSRWAAQHRVARVLQTRCVLCGARGEAPSGFFLRQQALDGATRYLACPPGPSILEVVEAEVSACVDCLIRSCP